MTASSSRYIRFMPLVLAFATIFWSSTAELLQLQIIHRHGARPHLIKHPTDPGLEERVRGPSLFPGGFIQLSTLGKYISETYVQTEFREILRRDISSVSSNFQRTLLSSRAFLNNLTESGRVVTTSIFADDENDWRIRGYALCPRLTQRFEDFTQTNEYREMRDSKNGTDETNREFVERLAEPLESVGEIDTEDKTFEHIFNVYDRYLIRREDNYNERNIPPGQPDQDIEDLEDNDFQRLRALADWYESAKFSFAVHNLHVAGGLVARIIEQMRDATAGDRARQVLEFSAHYPTLLTLLGSMRAGSGAERENPADRIPGFGAALLIEVRRDGENDEPYVTLKWYPGDGEWRQGTSEDFEGRIEEFSLQREPCNQVGGNKCRVDDFIRLMEEAVIDSAEFCDICESNAEFCIARQAGCSAGTKVVSGVVGLLVGVLVGLGMAYIYASRVGRRKRRMFESTSDEQGDPWGADAGALEDGTRDIPAPGTFREVTP